jgi:glycosyltransferase involved in cell wall biosynthesis
MIAAFKIHLKNNPNAQLWIVGDSNEKAKLNQLIVTKQLQNSVTLFGGKFGKEKENLLQQMDIFIHPSRNEGLPTSVIEAASYGKPSIVTEATNIGELICDCNAGLVVQGQNIEELEQAMQKLTTLWNNQDDFKNARTNAILMVKENFNWRKITKEFNSKLYYA